MAVWYGAHVEDYSIAMLLRDDDHNTALGYYVDCGAWDPLLDSVTKHFYDRQWNGINVEPNKHYYDLLVNERPRDVNLRCAVGSKAEEARDFYVIKNTGCSTLDSTHDLPPDKTHTEVVPVRTLADILLEYPCPSDRFFAFVKIDVEGWEVEVLKGMDLKRNRPHVFCIESGLCLDGVWLPHYKTWEPMLLKAGYRFAKEDPINRFYVNTRDQRAWKEG